MEEYLGIIKAFAGNFVPRDYVACDGRLLQISTNSPLYALLGTVYGGDGQNTFAVPDLRGRTLIGIGQGPGLSRRTLGEMTGTESTPILIPNMPAHSHAATSALTLKVSDKEANVAVPVAGNALAAMIDNNANQLLGYTSDSPTVPLGGGTVTTNIAATGGTEPVSVLQPVLAITYIICVSGGFPSRN